MNRIIKSIIITAIVTVITITTHAQFSIGGPGTNGSGTNANGTLSSPPSPTVPFDGGFSLILLASGIGYGAKKIRRKK